ncbi:MAG TPA: tRNA (adenosine(37)-N6)-threonylcarbamoyltransferase complex dimerization subunit type 1 TsaB [Candidatus Saccharimonadales bacterium]|nr:tRNA (adenosine(37)-N6)-threonylcarbamoyltransferase complex dimerization subunit type 1 TsaB [Candidatus Saccharimonadales bacterium]
MNILAIRTDKPQAELYVYQNGAKTAELKWQAHRRLAETINVKIDEILDLLSISLDSIGGIVCYSGPGSFTGLRIGFSAANALAFACDIPVTASGGKDWIQGGISDLAAGKFGKIAAPEYGAPPRTTKPKK